MARKGAPDVPKFQSSAGAQERQILRNAERLADDPEIVIPRIEGGGFLTNLLNPAKRVERHLRKVHDARGDEEKLKKLSKKGPPYARAYAVLLRIEHKGEVPYFANAKLPWGNVPYANWGEAPGNYHLGLQHWHERRLRLLAVKDWAQDKGFWFYATPDHLVCTGKHPDPPEDIVEEGLQRLNAGGHGDHRTCPHGGPGDDARGITLTWRSAGITIALCGNCLQPNGNSAHALLTHVMAPQAWADLDVEAHVEPLETPGYDVPNVPPAEASADDVETYLRGRTTDHALLEAARKARRDALSHTDQRIFVAGDTVYGDDVDTFLDALGATGPERTGLDAALHAHDGPVVLDRATPGRALQTLWPQHGLRILTEVTNDEDLAEALHQEAPSGGDNLAALLRRAAKAGERSALRANLPTYTDLPPELDLANRVARAYRLEGAAGARQELRNRSTRDGKGKAVAWALTRALGGEEDAWKYSHTEKELGEALKDAAKHLLEADPDTYHDALSTLSNGAGLGQPPDPQDAS